MNIYSKEEVKNWPRQFIPNLFKRDYGLWRKRAHF
jgi:hypothetical protein